METQLAEARADAEHHAEKERALFKQVGELEAEIERLRRREKQLVQELELGEGEMIQAAIVVGYPAIVPEPPTKRPPVVKWI